MPIRQGGGQDSRLDRVRRRSRAVEERELPGRWSTGSACNGTLNPILKKKVGSTFDVVTSEGERQTYRIAERDKVDRGDLQPEWFRTNGSPQLTLFTCSDLDRGKFRKTSVIVAEPAVSTV